MGPHPLEEGVHESRCRRRVDCGPAASAAGWLTSAAPHLGKAQRGPRARSTSSRLGPARLARPRVSRAGGGRARLLGTAEAERAAPEPQPFQALSVRGSVKAESRAVPRAWGPSFLPTRQQWLPCVVYGPSLLPPLPCLAEGQGAWPASLWAPVSSFGCRGAVSALGPSQAGCGGEGRRPPPRPAPGSGCGSATGVGGEHRRAWSPRDPTRGAFH